MRGKRNADVVESHEHFVDDCKRAKYDPLRAEIAFDVDRIRTLRQHVIFFCTAKTTSAQCEATVPFSLSPIV